MLCLYTGTDARVYPAYRDAERGRTLEAAPGAVCDITAAPGVTVPPPDGRWRVLPQPPAPKTSAPPAKAAVNPKTTPAPAEGAACTESEG